MREADCIDVVIENAKNEMSRLTYAKKTIRTHELVWKTFKNYAKEREETVFTAELTEDFLGDTFNYPQIYASGIRMPEGVRDKIRSMRILKEFHFRGILPGKLLPPPKECPESYKAVYEQYREYCAIEDRTDAMKKNYARTALQIALLLTERAVKCCGDIGLPDIDAFVIQQQVYTKHTVKATFQRLKHFLRYLYSKGHTVKDFSECVPRVLIYAKGNIPSTLSAEQTERLIASFDRGNPIGKRDYAIILLALELGVRSSDISSLRFENIDWVQRRIRIVQEKQRML